MVHPLVGLISIGVGYSLYAAAIWPSIAYVVEKKCLGTAYGITTAIQNAGLAFVPLISGKYYYSVLLLNLRRCLYNYP